MSLVSWQPRYALGIPSVDHEHRELIDLINALHDELLTEGSHDAVADFLGEIYARIAAHFALEERLMRDGAYPEFAPHKADHDRLLDDFRSRMDAFESDAAFDPAALGSFLDQWFSVHFSTHDPKLHAWLHPAQGR